MSTGLNTAELPQWCNYNTENNFSAVHWIFLLLLYFRGNANGNVGAKQNFVLAEVLRLISANSNVFRITRFAKLVNTFRSICCVNFLLFM